MSTAASPSNEHRLADSNKLAILAQQTSQLYAALNSAIIATFINASILVFIQWSVIDHVILLIWLMAIILVGLARGITSYRYKTAAPPPEKATLWSRRFITGSLLASVAWGTSSIWLFPVDDSSRQVFLAFVVGGMAAGAVTTLSYMRLPVYFFLGATLIPLAARFIYSGTELGIAMGAMLILYLIMMFLAANRTHKHMKQNICLRLENAEQERSLQQSDHRYRTLLNNATDAFFLHDFQGRFLDVNDQACRSLGYTHDELVNLSVSDIEICADLKMIRQKWPELEQGESIRLEGIHRRKDGTTFPVDVSAGAVQVNDEHLISVLVRDVTQRKQTEEAIRSSQQRMALHVQRTPLGVIEWDKNFCVTEWNPAAETIFGYTKEEALGRHAKELITPDYVREDVDVTWKQLLSLEGGLQSRNENVTKNGDTLLGEWYNTPLVDEAGEVIGVASLVQDITKQNNAEVALVKAKEDSESANRAKSEFLSSMSHELRTPLNAVLGFGQLLEIDDTLSDDQKDTVQEILKAGHHLLELINEVLDLAKVESGHIDMLLETVEVSPIIEECMNLVDSLADQYDIHLCHTGLTEGAAMRADRTRLKQALLNLLSNAIKYNRAGGSVQLDVQPEGSDRLRISVTDTGSGIPAERMGELFQPFSRLDAENSEIEGTGIGLTLTRRIVELMGGTVAVESEVGTGSTFWIALPLESVDRSNPGHKAAAEGATPTQGAEAAEHTVLYIEDNPANLKLVAQLLGRRRHIHLLTAHTPELGIEFVRTRHPELILLDINMPGMDGYQVLEAIKADASTNGIPVVAITANAMPSDIERGKAAGFSDYLTKPLDVPHFHAVIDQLLGSGTVDSGEL